MTSTAADVAGVTGGMPRHPRRVSDEEPAHLAKLEYDQRSRLTRVQIT